MDEIIATYLDMEVEIRTLREEGEYRNVGFLRRATPQWLELETDGKVLLFPVYNIRSVRPTM